MPSQKKKTLTEFLQLNVRVLNKLNWANYEYLQNQKKSTKFSPKWIIKTILTKEGLNQNYILFTKRLSKR